MWIVSRRIDVLCFLAPALLAIPMLAMNRGFGVSAVWIWWFWATVTDDPHFFATYTRVRPGTGLLRKSLPWLLAPVGFVMAGFLTGSRQPALWFFAITAVWAFWHVLRQHYGLLVIYQKKNGEPSGKEARLEYVTFHLANCSAFAAFLFTHPVARELIFLPTQPGPADQWVRAVLIALAVGSAIFYLVNQSFTRFNLPKNLLFFSTLALHWTIFMLPPFATDLDIRLYAPLVTLWHNVQYLALVGFANRRSGTGARLWRSVVAGIFLLGAVRVALVYAGIGQVIPDRGGFLAMDMPLMLWWGVSLQHYYLDRKLWRVRTDTRLAEDLDLRETARLEWTSEYIHA